jgi:hypothetical protein
MDPVIDNFFHRDIKLPQDGTERPHMQRGRAYPAGGNARVSIAPAHGLGHIYDYGLNTKVLPLSKYMKKGVLKISTIVLCFLDLIGFILYFSCPVVVG